MKRKKLLTKVVDKKQFLPLLWHRLNNKEKRDLPLKKCFLIWKEIPVESRDKTDCWIVIKGKARTKKQLQWLLEVVPKDGMEEFEIEAMVKAKSAK